MIEQTALLKFANVGTIEREVAPKLAEKKEEERREPKIGQMETATKKKNNITKCPLQKRQSARQQDVPTKNNEKEFKN